MQTIRFNTGRHYTAYGQRISATLHDDGVVTFHDHDRMIDGLFTLGMNCQFNRTEVMHWYDSGQVSSSRRSWEDAFMHGGCNATWED